jgi:hypothetical protein
MVSLARRTRSSIPAQSGRWRGIPGSRSRSNRRRTEHTAQPQYTIRERVPLTIVDVVVTDSKGLKVDQPNVQLVNPGLSLLARPLPTRNLGSVDPVLMCVINTLDNLVLQPLLRMRGRCL